VPEARTRRRGARLEQAILDAAWAELNQVGYARFTIEAVAARAETSRSVIYRRWPNRAKLVVAAWQRNAPTPEDMPDTGALRTDLLAVFTRVADRASSVIGEVIAGVMSEAFRHPEVIEVLRSQLHKPSHLTETLNAIVRRAIERGELSPVRLPLRVARLPLDLVRNELMLRGGALSGEAVTELVDEVYLPLLRGLERV
jgi:AcrR family transcriptional regulator